MVRLLLPVALALATVPALATAGSESLGTFKDWEAISFEEGGKKGCYVVARPASSKPENVVRGDIYLMVTHIPADKVRDRVTVRIGYPFKEESRAALTIDGAEFQLATADHYAWPDDRRLQSRLVRAMKAGREMTIRGVSRRGTRTTDRFSLYGFTAAHRAIERSCR